LAAILVPWYNDKGGQRGSVGINTVGGFAMDITLTPELELALNKSAQRKGVTPQELVLDALRQRFLAPTPLEPIDEWERTVLALGTDCGVSLPHSALSSEGLYD
jgi:hypothetical protein